MICVLRTHWTKKRLLKLTNIVTIYFWQHVLVPKIADHPVLIGEIASVPYILALDSNCFQTKVLNMKNVLECTCKNMVEKSNGVDTKYVLGDGNGFSERNPEIAKNDDDERSVI